MKKYLRLGSVAVWAACACPQAFALSPVEAVTDQLCANPSFSHVWCDWARGHNEKVQAFKKRYAAAEPPRDLAQLDSWNLECDGLAGMAASLEEQLGKAKIPTKAFTEEIEPLRQELLQRSQRFIGGKLEDLSRAVAALERNTTEFELSRPLPSVSDAPIIRSLGSAGGLLFDRFQELSLSIDRVGDPVEAPCRQLREAANAIARRLAALRDRLIGLQRRLGLPPSPQLDFRGLLGNLPAPVDAAERKVSARPLHLPGLDVFGPVRQTSPIFGQTGFSGRQDSPLASWGSLLLKPQVSPPPAPRSSADWKPGFDAQTRLLRWLGATRTVGDPAGRAGLVHRQAGETCAIVSQQEILRHYGVVSKEDPQKQEERLAQAAEALGNFDSNEGTSDAYVGNLLLSHGLLVSKKELARDDELAAAAKRGGMLIVGLDSGILWDMPKELGFDHAVVVTGAETSAWDGRILGYYINDSATNPPGRGRFVPLAKFLSAWHRMDSTFVEAE